MLAPFSVSSFLKQVNDIVWGEYSIEGEVSQYKVSQGRWVFFDLKDDVSVLNCFSTVFMARQPLVDGMKVRVFGCPKIYEKTGKFSFTVQKIELIGEGSFKKAFLLLKEKLEKEGLFNPERKRTVPEVPERLGVITSRDSAAWGDFRRILSNRFGGIELVLCHVNVQGGEAIGDIVKACEKLNAYPHHLDAIVFIRGGGSAEDLAAFNDETVVRALYASRIPIVTGIGHERDITLVDYVADVRASTPSNAAELLAPDKADMLVGIERDREFLAGQLEYTSALRRQHIERYNLLISTAFKQLFSSFERVIERFELTSEQLKAHFEHYERFVRQSHILLANVDPKRILKRGYSLVRDQEGKIITSVAGRLTKEPITIEVHDGLIEAQTERIIPTSNHYYA